MSGCCIHARISITALAAKQQKSHCLPPVVFSTYPTSLQAQKSLIGPVLLNKEAETWSSLVWFVSFFFFFWDSLLTP